MSDTDTMQAELEAAGYAFEKHHIGITYYSIHHPEVPRGKYEHDTAIKIAYAHLQEKRELDDLRTLFDLCVRTFDYPREVEMLGAGLTDAEREMLREAFETRFKELDTHTEDNADDTD